MDTSVEAEVSALLPGGVGVACCCRERLLVPHVLPGERVRVCRKERRRGAWWGRAVEILAPSPARVSPPCPVAERCGGCALQHVQPAAQAEYKSAWVRDAFAEFIEHDTHWQSCSGEPGLRRRVRWFVGKDADGRFLGFHARCTHQPVRHAQCLVLEAPLNRLRVWLESRLPDAVRSVQATLLADGMHVVFEAERAMPNLPEWPEFEGAQWWWRHGEEVQPMRRPVRTLHDRVPAGAGEVSLAVGPCDFVQGSQPGNRALVRQVQQWLPKDCRRIVDLFCGAGNLSLPAAHVLGARVAGAEGNAASVRAARFNARRLRVAGEFIACNLFAPRQRAEWVAADALILDPPRKGAKAVCAMMHALLPGMIIMVNCDVAAGARDARLLHTQGYRLRALRALDLFPGAGHVEAMSLWTR
ncbi:MAG: 23S rRNA methyltransferase [Zetaproteobacteria bacterium]|nr:MAG: 23S rRNA methyltransferase [Zetaproteobacteria bacterium]